MVNTDEGLSKKGVREGIVPATVCPELLFVGSQLLDSKISAITLQSSLGMPLLPLLDLGELHKSVIGGTGEFQRLSYI